MITSISIENLRGIAEGELEGLAPLTILTGPNASGKSTVLDALLIGASDEPDEAVGRAVARHPHALSGSRWLFGKAKGKRKAKLTIEIADGRTWARTLEYLAHSSGGLEEQLVQAKGRPPYSMVHLSEGIGEYSDHWISSWTGFSSDNIHFGRLDRYERASPIAEVRLVDTGLPIPLHRAYSGIVEMGLQTAIQDFLRELIGDFKELSILVEEGDTPVLSLVYPDSSIPVALAGDGIQAFLQLALETYVLPEGLLLLEEPEVYQHPKALWNTARVLLAHLHRGVQLVLTTHSLELIDALINQASEVDLAAMAVFNLALKEQRLLSSRRQGEEIRFARDELEKDLR